MITCTACGRDRSDDSLSDGERTVPCPRCGATDLSFVTTTPADAADAAPFLPPGPWRWDRSRIQPGPRVDCPVCREPHVVFQEVASP